MPRRTASRISCSEWSPAFKASMAPTRRAPSWASAEWVFASTVAIGGIVMARMPLKEADKVEILTLLDNTIDILMAGTPQAKRFPLRSDALTRESLVAEHGFAALVSVSRSNGSESLLFDA